MGFQPSQNNKNALALALDNVQSDDVQCTKELIRMDFCHFVSDEHFCKAVVRLSSRTMDKRTKTGEEAIVRA